MMTKPRVGLIGLGAIGQILASHLLRAHGRLTVFDLDPERVNALARSGANPADSARDLGSKCDFVVVSLPSPSAVESAITGADGVLAGLAPGSIVLDMSTIDPQTSRRMYAAASQGGASYLDAPVSGGQPLSGGTDGARTASLTFMVGGDENAFERAKPVMAAMGKHFFHLGPAGAGSTVKLISNLASGIYALVFAEAFVLGAAAGFDAPKLLEVFEQTDAKSFFMTDYLAPRLLRDDFEPGFSVRLQLKDHRLAAELGHELGVPLLLNQVAIHYYEMMAAQGRAENDVADAVRFLGVLAAGPRSSSKTRGGAQVDPRSP